MVAGRAQVVVVGGGAQRGRTPSRLLAKDAVEVGIVAEAGLDGGGERRGAPPCAVQAEEAPQSLLVAEPVDRYAAAP
jgi:hypothetical protein